MESVNGEGQTGRRKSRYRLISLEHLLEGKDYIIGSCKYRNEKIGTDGLLQAQKHGEVRLVTLEDLYR